MALEVDMGWSIICPDGCIRNKPYLDEKDADFDSLYLTSRGCFDYNNKHVVEHKIKCPQGDHDVAMSLFDVGAGLRGALKGPCDIIGCIRSSKWRTGLSVISTDRSTEVLCNIALKTCNLHKKTIKPCDIINDTEWELLACQFADRGIAVPGIRFATLIFHPLTKK